MGGRLHHALVTSLLQLLHCRHRSSTSCSAVVLNILLHFVPVYHRLADHPWRTLNCTNLHDCCDTKTINCFINPLFPQRYYDIICVLISNCPLTVAPWRGCWRFTLKNDALWLTEQLNCVTLDSLRFNCHNSDRAGLCDIMFNLPNLTVQYFKRACWPQLFYSLEKWCPVCFKAFSSLIHCTVFVFIRLGVCVTLHLSWWC